jgi:hypothetical protein
MVQLSGVTNKDELNPFENYTRIKSVTQSNYDKTLQSHRAALFNTNLENFFRNYYGFVFESENKLYRNFIHCTGIAIARIHHNVSLMLTLTFSIVCGRLDGERRGK